MGAYIGADACLGCAVSDWNGARGRLSIDLEMNDCVLIETGRAK
jgi:hypothetical protein